MGSKSEVGALLQLELEMVASRSLVEGFVKFAGEDSAYFTRW